MGLFYVAGRLTGPTELSEEVELLVDTGSTFLVVPQTLADRLGLRPIRTCPIQTAGGRDETWPLAEVRLGLNGDEVTTRCLVAPAGPAILGAVALESLLLAVDPIAKRLVSVKGFVGQQFCPPQKPLQNICSPSDSALHPDPLHRRGSE